MSSFVSNAFSEIFLRLEIKFPEKYQFTENEFKAIDFAVLLSEKINLLIGATSPVNIKCAA